MTAVQSTTESKSLTEEQLLKKVEELEKKLIEYKQKEDAEIEKKKLKLFVGYSDEPWRDCQSFNAEQVYIRQHNPIRFSIMSPQWKDTSCFNTHYKYPVGKKVGCLVFHSYKDDNNDKYRPSSKYQRVFDVVNDGKTAEYSFTLDKDETLGEICYYSEYMFRIYPYANYQAYHALIKFHDVINH